MLVLSRRVNESIVIDGNIRITVIGIRGGQIRLGIEAPDRVGIFREELLVPIASDPAPGKPIAGALPDGTPHLLARAVGRRGRGRGPLPVRGVVGSLGGSGTTPSGIL